MMQTLTPDIWMQNDPQHSVLLMDESGSVGLDLSFASHVFLMEPLENASLEEQVVSRAHRMGARADVQVETLVMRVRAGSRHIPITSWMYLLRVLVCRGSGLAPFPCHCVGANPNARISTILMQLQCAMLPWH